MSSGGGIQHRECGKLEGYSRNAAQANKVSSMAPELCAKECGGLIIGAETRYEGAQHYKAYVSNSGGKSRIPNRIATKI